MEDSKLIQTDFGHFRKHLSKKWTNKYADGLSKLDQDRIFLTAANMSIKKADFEALEGFNENLSDAEDFELAIRAFQRGMDLYFDKSNNAWHDDIVNCRQFVQRQKEYFQARLDLEAIIPDKYKRKEPNTGVLRKLIYRIFANSFVVNSIDCDHLVFLPRKIRYKIYDITITGYRTLSLR